mgnify:FL=1|jgi:FkbM family methyltransferase
MIDILKKVYKKIHIIQNIYLKNNFFFKKQSYSMEGEDLIISELSKNINKGFYVDAGCYHPLHFNNTQLLYEKKWQGINIDLSEFSIDLFNFMRPNDININAAISNDDREITFYYQKKLSQLSTIKKKEAQIRMQGYIKEKKIKSKKLTTILNDSVYNKIKIDFLNIDLEGADFEALKSLDFETYRPKIICIEIINEKVETSEVYKFLSNLNYTKKWSGTFNHIFIDNTI